MRQPQDAVNNRSNSNLLDVAYCHTSVVFHGFFFKKKEEKEDDEKGHDGGKGVYLCGLGRARDGQQGRYVDCTECLWYCE